MAVAVVVVVAAAVVVLGVVVVAGVGASAVTGKLVGMRIFDDKNERWEFER